MKTPNRINIDKDHLKEEGFLLQISSDQYLLASGPFCRAFKPSPDIWSLFHPFFFPSEFQGQRWCIPASTAVFSREKLLVFLEDQKKDTMTLQWQSPDFSLFNNFFLSVQKQIKQNKIQKVVPVFFETADYCLKERDVLALVYRLIFSSRRAVAAYAYWSGQYAIIGATPEYLFRKKGRYVQTMALAGTARNSQHDLLKDLKEQWEHQLVVEELKKLLAPFGEYRLSDTYIYKVGDIRHLRADFKLQMKTDLSYEKLCRLLHPTPALGGLPREEALSLLIELHQKPNLRYGFGAPFGVSMGHEAFCVVAIRNVQFVKDKAYIGSGCGLVKGSRIESEWEELKKKRQSVKDILF